MTVANHLRNWTRCPRCKSPMAAPRVALSRRDNRTNICPECGIEEALEDAGYRDAYQGKRYWKEIKS